MRPLAPVESLLIAAGLIVGSVFALAAAVVVVPTRVSADATFHDEQVDAWADLRWALGAISAHVHAPEGVVVRIFGWQVLRYQPRRSAREESTSEPAAKRARPSPRFVAAVLRRIVRSLRFQGELRGTLGSGDPARTAWWAAVLLGSRRLLPAVDTRQLQLDWAEARLEVDGHVQGLIWPIEIAWIVASEWWRSR